MENEIRQDKIVGSRRFSNYFWSFFLFVGGLGFLLAGISSYFKVNLLPFANPTELVFIHLIDFNPINNPDVSAKQKPTNKK